MNCTEFHSLQSEYIDGTLDSATMEEIRAHMEECPSCRHMYAELSALVRTLHAMDDVSVPAALADKIIANLPTQKKKVISFPKVFRSWQTYSAFAACILVAVTLYTGVFDRYTVTNDGQVSYTVSGPEAEITSAPAPLEPTETVVPKTAIPSAAPRMAQPPISAPTENMQLPDEASAAPLSMARSLPGPKEEAATVYHGADAPMTAAMGTSAPYQPVASLWKMHLIFTTADPAAEAIFNAHKTQGAVAIEAALQAAGIDYTIQEEIEADYTEEYNTLIAEAAALFPGENEENIRLPGIEKEMRILEDTCKVPSVSLSIHP